MAIGNVWATGVWEDTVWADGVWADEAAAPAPVVDAGTFFPWAREHMYQKQLAKPARAWPTDDYVEPGNTEHTT